MAEDAAHVPQKYQRLGLVLGPVLALLIGLFFRPDGLSGAGVWVAAVAVWMAIWWATEATHVAVTALLPIVAFPFLGVMSIKAAAAPYAHPMIYLFFGGFVIALAIERCGLHRRIALTIFGLVGADARALIGGFMVAAAVVSMWISNTSTTLMLLPVAVSVVTVIGETMPGLAAKQQQNFGASLLIGLAYGATLGGIATLVGTPPNAFLAAFLSDTYNLEVGFAQWMLLGLPLSFVMLPLGWLVLTRLVFPVSFRASPQAMGHIEDVRTGLGRMSRAEIRVALVFGLVVLGWMFRKNIQGLPGLTGVSDTGIAMMAAIAAFLIPSGTDGKTLVTWEDMARLPWAILILFGGGLALAAGVSQSGLAAWLGEQLGGLSTINTVVLIVLLTAFIIFLTELTSNLATTTTFLPVVATIAEQMGGSVMLFVVPVTLAASCAFMLPIATPPNAIVYSSGRVTIPDMIRAGLVMNVIAAAVLSVLAVWLVPLVFG